MKVRNLYEVNGKMPHDGTVRSWRIISGDDVESRNLVFIDDDIVEPGMAIKGHKDDWEEIYYILNGYGEMQVGRKKMKVSEGDVLFIPPKTIHSLRNTTNRPLRFICVAVRC